ncbi:hypothetical protein PVT71_27630 (plasmid) [Salipiger sp. H15]|uniref:Colanic acid biosynthesis acetyltransferase n=1 Tax=Alloyangia sp. H15 TaxID=3029062 RepID=A0AAU8AUE1_9RHOB
MTASSANGSKGTGRLPILGAPTFPARHRAMRLLWSVAWLLCARWTPPGWMPVRRLLLRAFGARLHPTARVRSSARIWWPAHLEMGPDSSLGPKATCYNVAPITLGARANVSQGVFLCAAGHNIDRPDFPLRPGGIVVGDDAWVAAEAFVGPDVVIGTGAVLGARGVAMRHLDPWTVYAGNPAVALRTRAAFTADDIFGAR